jgi:hypothetical protein
MVNAKYFLVVADTLRLSSRPYDSDHSVLALDFVWIREISVLLEKTEAC